MCGEGLNGGRGGGGDGDYEVVGMEREPDKTGIW